MPLAVFTWSDLPDVALSVFLVVTGLALGYAFLRLGGTLGRLSSFVRGTERELLPVISKVGGTVDRVNGQLEKVDKMTDSAVDAVESIDSAVRTVSQAVTRPVQRLSGLVAGLAHGAAAFRTGHDWRGAVRTAKDAAARREQDLEDELGRRERGED